MSCCAIHTVASLRASRIGSPFDHLVDKAHDLARLHMPFGLQLGVDQLSVHRHLETTAVRGSKRETIDEVFELLQQVSCQAHGPVSVVSDGAVDDLDLQHDHSQTSKMPNPGTFGVQIQYKR